MALPKVDDRFNAMRGDGHIRFSLQVTRVDAVYVHSRITSGKGGNLSTPHSDFDRYLRSGILAAEKE